MRIGILGAGLIGGSLAKLGADRGHDVMLSSRHPEALAGLAARIGCRAGSLEAAAGFGEVCVLAVPLMALDSLPGAELAGKAAIDAMNYYPERDGAIEALDRDGLQRALDAATRDGELPHGSWRR